MAEPESFSEAEDIEIKLKLANIKELEKIIERGFKSYLEVGFALLEIRERKLYKQLGYKNFESYCIDRWKIKRAYANRQILASKVVSNLKQATIVTKNLPQNESQVRPIANLDVDLQRTIWTEAIEVAGGTPTAKVVKEVKTKLMKEIEKQSTPTHEDIQAIIEIGDICIIQAGDLTALKPYQGFWCVIKAKSDRVFDIDVFDRTLTMVKPEYLLKLECTEEERDAGILLMSRMQRIASVETVSFLINSCLITLSKGRDFILPDRDREILYFIENRLGIISN